MTLTVTSLGPSSTAATLHSCSKAALALEIGAAKRAESWALIDEIATNEPPPALTSSRAPYFRVSIVPTTLFAKTLCHCETQSSVTGAIWPRGSPAQATTALSEPVTAFAAPTAASTCFSSVMSAGISCRRETSSDSDVSVSRASCSRSGLRPAMVTVAPEASRARAMPSPMPEPPPVTSALTCS